MRDFFQRFMFGRYGNDHLNLFLAGLYLVLWFINLIVRFSIIRYIDLVLIVLVFFRLLSRNIEKRRAENEKFLQIAGPAIEKIKQKKNASKDRDHTYFKCPKCGQQMRAPKGMGKIRVNCRNCGNCFEKKT